MGPVNYLYIARRIFAQLTANGAIKVRNSRRTAEYVDWYKDWLETYVMVHVYEALQKLGKVNEFKALPDDDEEVRERFLSIAIPNYLEFLNKAVMEGRDYLLSKAPSGFHDIPSSSQYASAEHRA